MKIWHSLPHELVSAPNVIIFTNRLKRFHNFRIKSKLCTNTEQFSNFFFIRISNVWNKLPQDLVSAPNIVIFQNRLKNFNLYSIASLTF